MFAWYRILAARPIGEIASFVHFGKYFQSICQRPQAQGRAKVGGIGEELVTAWIYTRTWRDQLEFWTAYWWLNGILT